MKSFRDTFRTDVHAELSKYGEEDSDYMIGAVYDAARATGYVILTKKSYGNLIKDANKYIVLANGGVDNWEGYESAMEALEDEDE